MADGSSPRSSRETQPSAKRSNNAIWKLAVPEGLTPKKRLEDVLKAYAVELTADASKRPLAPVALEQSIPGVQLDLYVRPRFSTGLLPFIKGYLTQEDDEERFKTHGADACLFLSTKSSLFAVTSGSAYHIIADFVDYSYPFDTAKKLISNKFSAADVRDMIGSRTSRSETYRSTYAIDKSEAMDTIWKKLVGRLNAQRLPEDSPLRGLINPDKPPAVEIKSCFVLRQKLDLANVCILIEALETLPEPSEEHLRELSFLDNLYPIKNDQELTGALTRQFVESIRQEMLAGDSPDVDVLDPYEIIPFNAGFDFKLGRAPIGDSPPDIDGLLSLLREMPSECLEGQEPFFEEVSHSWLSYRTDPDDRSKRIRRRLLEFLHGQADFEGKTYFRIDKVWYRSLGDFLENLKRDFIDEVFTSDDPVLLGSDLTFLPWTNGSESTFNRKQASEQDFYFGDEVFATTESGKVELFDLLKIDDEKRMIYVIHVKKGFGAKMRDACSQIRMAADVIFHDIRNEKQVLVKYYNEAWSVDPLNTGVDEATFLSWFNYAVTYVVLCSTRNEFVADDFTTNRLRSHIARRETLATKNQMKRDGHTFRLAHTRYEGLPDG